MIEWDRVNELRSEIGAEDFAEVVALFLAEAEDVFARISIAEGPAALEANLHFMKGAALNLGFREVARLCQEGERRAALGDCAMDLNRLRRSYANSKAELSSGRGLVSAA
jgi:histidine phosphotransfer protein HptB